MLDHTPLYRNREESNREIGASTTSHLPMVKRWLVTLISWLVIASICSGLVVFVIELFKLLKVSQFQEVRESVVFTVCFGICLIMGLIGALLSPNAIARRRGFAYAELGQKFLVSKDYEAATLNFERAAQEFNKIIGPNFYNRPKLGEVYQGLGSAYQGLRNYEQSLTSYALAHQVFQQTFLGEVKQAEISHQMALLEARIPQMRVQAERDLRAFWERTKDVQCLAILAELSILNSDLENFVWCRKAAVKYSEGQPPHEELILFLSLLGLLSIDVGDVRGSLEMNACSRRINKQYNLEEVLKHPEGFVHFQRTMQVLAQAISLLNESGIQCLCQDYSRATDLVCEAITALRDRANVAPGLREWEIASLAYLGRIQIDQGEFGLFWYKFYAFRERHFPFIDNLVKDDLDYHDYVGFGLHKSLKIEEALDREKSLLDEALQRHGSTQFEHLLHISAIYQAARDWSLASDYQTQALEIAKLHGVGIGYLACLLRQIALTLQGSLVTGEYVDLDPMLNEANLLISLMDDAYYRACGLSKLGAVYFAWGKADIAVTYYQQAVQVAQTARLLGLEMDLQLLLASIFEEQRQWENALATYTDAQLLSRKCPFVPVQTLTASAARARCLQHLHNNSYALEESRSYLQLSDVISTVLSERHDDVKLRIKERDAINNLILILSEESGDNIRAFEQIEYFKTRTEFSFDKLNALLRQQAIPVTVAEYYTTHDHTLLFVVDAYQPNVSMYRVPISLRQLRDYIDQFREEVCNYHQWHGELESTWQELMRPLIEPVMAHLQRQGILCVIPHGLLHQLPFHAMQHEGQYILDRCPIVYAPSGAILLQFQNRHAQTWRKAVVVGNPDQDLQGATAEVKEVAKLFETVPRLGHDAKFDLHREHIDTDVLHVATHGLFDQDQPTLSGILLADELLTISKISEMQIQANLVTLSGCETGLSKEGPQNQLISLTNAFFKIGVPSMVVSLWKADDTATTELMVEFYTQLKLGAPSLAHAMRSAQLAVRRRRSHPYFWSPFIVVGDWH